MCSRWASFSPATCSAVLHSLADAAGKLDKSERQLERRDRHLAETQQQLKLYKQWVAGERRVDQLTGGCGQAQGTVPLPCGACHAQTLCPLHLCALQPCWMAPARHCAAAGLWRTWKRMPGGRRRRWASCTRSCSARWRPKSAVLRGGQKELAARWLRLPAVCRRARRNRRCVSILLLCCCSVGRFAALLCCRWGQQAANGASDEAAQQDEDAAWERLAEGIQAEEEQERAAAAAAAAATSNGGGDGGSGGGDAQTTAEAAAAAAQTAADLQLQAAMLEAAMEGGCECGFKRGSRPEGNLWLTPSAPSRGVRSPHHLCCIAPAFPCPCYCCTEPACCGAHSLPPTHAHRSPTKQPCVRLVCCCVFRVT